ncbi:amino acid adenylation domain-containing protein [Brevibacterium sp. JNUCC-42]|nr:amino acid adenylation domain-containing protein [Brevibacterium sp. JNUCC-42]
MAYSEKISRNNVEDIMGLSPVQEGMLFHFLKEPELEQYHEQLSLTISGKLDLALFKQAWNDVIQANEMLRTLYRWREVNQPVQIILKEHQLAFDYYDYSALATTEQTKRIAKQKEADLRKQFTLLEVPFRIELYKMATDRYQMVISNHHILYDGWSNGIILQEFFQRYHSLEIGQLSSLPRKPKYKEYIKWLENQDHERQNAFWKEYLEGFNTQTSLAIKKRNAVKKGDVVKHKITLDHFVASQIASFCKEHQVTVASLFYAAWGLLLNRYNNTDDVIFGTTVSGRSGNIEGLEKVVGLFINTLPLRFKTDTEKDLLSYTKQVNQAIQLRTQFESTSLVNIKQASQLDKKEELFDTLLVIENYPLNKQLLQENQGLRVTSYEIHEITNYDLTVAVELFEETNMVFTYEQTLFDRDVVERMAQHYSRIIVQIIQSPTKRFVELELFSTGELEELEAWNQTNAWYAYDQPIYRLFSEQAKRTPEKIAVICGEVTLTYRQLDERTNQLARTLRQYGVGADAIVGICMERSVEMIVGLLAIAKAGGAYLPIDSKIPIERLSYILEDSGTKLVVTQQEFINKFTKECDTLNLDDKDIYHSDGNSLDDISGPRNLAYVIYTSGSTGKPKGVCIEHHSVVNRLNWMQKAYPISSEDVILQKTPYVFDVSVWELFWWAMQGATVSFLAPGQEGNPECIVETIQRDKVTTMHFVPSMLHVFLEFTEAFDQADKLRSLQRVFASGEALGVHLVKRFNSLFYDRYKTQLINLYGPTEACVDVSFFNCSPWIDYEKVPIGKPIDNTQFLVLDRNLMLQPVGVPGQLCISGVGLARGYANKPELTREKFIDHPFDTGKRLYLTGDLARWLSDGNIEYLGRIDYQVKVRGFRIELGEIEHQLLDFPSMKEAVVLVKQDKKEDDYLVAYVVCEEELNAAEVKQFLLKRLPEYMVPNTFIRIEEMPLTTNGKLDRKALPVPQVTELTQKATYVKPQTEIERKIADIYKEVLEVESVGLYDNFFDIGGNSLKLIRIYSRLSKALGKELTVATLFRYPTVASLTQYLAQADTEIEKEGKDTKRKLSRQLNQESQHGVKDGKGQDVAVIGMAGRFPGAKNIDQFWNNLKNGIESIRFFTDEELLEAGADTELIKRSNYVKAKGYLDDFEYFDASLFDYMPKEAELMDPQLRLLHECAWEALEHAGYLSDESTDRIGTFVGASSNFHWLHQVARQNQNSLEEFSAMLLNEKDFFSTRLSYKLNLKGPSVTVQTACSTSLVAINMAYQELIQGNCEIAIAGGVGITYPPKTGYLYEDGMIHSPDGHCRAFDKDANGTIGGNGIGIVVLKRLHDAVLDGDTIHAVIKGGATNNDGIDKVGFTAPGVTGQAAVIHEAQIQAAIESESISYVEAHGTGTALGDPIELEALRLAFQTDKKGYCAIGSVKTNIGHLDAAAGVAGFIKTVLSLQHELLPPSLHYNSVNPKIDFANSPFFVNNQLTAWQRGIIPRRAGVSSFGMGGTNAHVILEEAPKAVNYPENRDWKLLMLSAKTETALKKAAENLQSYLNAKPDVNLSDVAYTLQIGRKTFPYRKVIVANHAQEAAVLLGLPDMDKVMTKQVAKRNRSVTFMFSGQGSQYINMGLRLYQKEEFFRTIVDSCSELLRPIIGYDIREIIYPSEHKMEWASEMLTQTELTQVVLFTVEYALAQTLMKWGIQPQAMIGHSIGEYVAACIAGVFSLEDALKLVTMRGKLMQSMPTGAMLSVRLNESALLPLIPADVSLAAVNSSALCVVSGSHEAIETCKALLIEKGVEHSQLHTSHAFHSAMMEGILTEFESVVRTIELREPKIPYLSNVTGTWISIEDATDTMYWVKHLRGTVKFATGVKELLDTEQAMFIEVGPGRVLSMFVHRHADKKPNHFVTNLLPHPQEQIAEDLLFYRKIAQLWLEGVQIDWRAFYEKEQRRRIPLPAYPFERKRFWTWTEATPTSSKAHNFLQENVIGKKTNIADWFYVPSWERVNLPKVEENRLALESVLIFADETSISQCLLKKLQQTNSNIVVVRTDTMYRKLNDRSFAIHPCEASHYDEMLRELKESGFTPTKVLHLWSLSEGEYHGLDWKRVELTLDVGFYSLVSFAQALGRHMITDPLDILVVTNNTQEVTGEEELQPEKATVLGFVKIAPLEYSNLQCRNIDILSISEPRKQEKVVQQLLEELEIVSEDKVVAYRNSYRWVQIMKKSSRESLMTTPRLKQYGVYLISGGMGGMGFAIAKDFAKTYQAKLVLIGRSEFPTRETWNNWLNSHAEDNTVSKKIREILLLESYGAEVFIARADVSNQLQMAEVIHCAIERFGGINGVVHAAGIADYAGLIQNRTRETVETILTPKIQGTLTLDYLLSEQKLDFFILCSSIGNVSYHRKIGQVAYNVANEFLDAYAFYKTARDGVYTVAINWPDWQEVGMSIESAKYWAKALNSNVETILQDGLSPSEGVEVLKRALHNSSPQVVVSSEDLIKKIAEGSAHFQAVLEKGQFSREINQRPELSTNYVAPKSEIEGKLANIWQKMFGIEQVGIYDNFFDLGASSLDLIQVNRKVKELLNLDISVVTMYEYPTIASLAAYLIQEMSADKQVTREQIKSDELNKSKQLMKSTILKMGRSTK